MLRCACGAYATVAMFGMAYCDAHAPEAHRVFCEDEVIGGVPHTRYLCEDCEMATDWVAASPLAVLQLALLLPCARWGISPPMEIQPVGETGLWEIMAK